MSDLLFFWRLTVDHHTYGAAGTALTTTKKLTNAMNIMDKNNIQTGKKKKTAKKKKHSFALEQNGRCEPFFNV